MLRLVARSMRHCDLLDGSGPGVAPRGHDTSATRRIMGLLACMRHG